MCFSTVVPGTLPVECTVQGYTALSEPNRYWLRGDNNSNCDSGVITSGNWYRFTGPAGVMMASQCIPVDTCHSGDVGWINGNHPMLVFEVTWPSICVHGGGSCCSQSQAIAIRNCGGFYVYQLKAPPYCDVRYCGVNGKYVMKLTYRFLLA